MHRPGNGFTMIELMVVVTIIVIIAMIAVPSLIAARLTANETVAIETLRSVNTAQHQFRMSGRADEDGDGVGEYGGFGELSGARGVRGSTVKVPTDVTGLRVLTSAGEVDRTGYYYRMYLPDASGIGVRERPGGGYLPGDVDPNLSEVIWCCYAWPARYGASGRRTFFMNQVGGIVTTESDLLSGTSCPLIRGGSAFITGNPDSITGRNAVGTYGADGNFWKSVQ